MKGLEGGRKGQGVWQKRTSIIILTSFLLFFVYRGCQNLKLFTEYMIELNLHPLVADGIERLFMRGILSKRSSSLCSQSAANLFAEILKNLVF